MWIWYFCISEKRFPNFPLHMYLAKNNNFLRSLFRFPSSYLSTILLTYALTLNLINLSVLATSYFPYFIWEDTWVMKNINLFIYTSQSSKWIDNKTKKFFIQFAMTHDPDMILLSFTSLWLALLLDKHKNQILQNWIKLNSAKSWVQVWDKKHFNIERPFQCELILNNFQGFFQMWAFFGRSYQWETFLDNFSKVSNFRGFFSNVSIFWPIISMRVIFGQFSKSE